MLLAIPYACDSTIVFQGSPPDEGIFDGCFEVTEEDAPLVGTTNQPAPFWVETAGSQQQAMFSQFLGTDQPDLTFEEVISTRPLTVLIKNSGPDENYGWWSKLFLFRDDVSDRLRESGHCTPLEGEISLTCMHIFQPELLDPDSNREDWGATIDNEINIPGVEETASYGFGAFPNFVDIHVNGEGFPYDESDHDTTPAWEAITQSAIGLYESTIDAVDQDFPRCADSDYAVMVFE